MAQLLFTKIVATVGPATEAPEAIVQLIQAGARCFRINFSHGTPDDHRRMLGHVRQASETVGIPVAAMGDLAGPKIRVGQVVDDGVRLEPGSHVAFVRPTVVAGAETPRASGEAVQFATTYPGLVDDVRPGQTVLIDDGRIRLICVEAVGAAEAARLVCRVVVGGTVTSNKGVNLPETDLSLPSLTDRDRRAIALAVDLGFDFLAQSFVRTADDVRALKSELSARGARSTSSGYGGVEVESHGWGFPGFLPIITKIEKPQALEDLSAILGETDAVMVARGDLGVELDLADVAVVQKTIIARCHAQGTPVIVATEMLQSMMDSPRPTRAEVSDVANAILDGADAVMLSGETAVGRWPVETVRMMSRIADRTLAHQRTQPGARSTAPPVAESKHRTRALAFGVKTIVGELGASLIAVWSHYGGSALFLSRHRIPRPVVAFSPSPAAVRRLSLLYGVQPIQMAQPASTAEFLRAVEAEVRDRGWVGEGDAVVFVHGEPIDRPGVTNKLSIHYVGDASDAAGRP